MSPGLMRKETGDLANEVNFKNAIVFWNIMFAV